MTIVVPDVVDEPAPRKPTRRRRVGRFTPRDVAVVGVLLGIPVALDVLLIWGPTLASVGLSFTSWDLVKPIKPVGTQNYEYIFDTYPKFWPAFQHNVLWLLFLALVATPFGLLLAVLLDKQVG